MKKEKVSLIFFRYTGKPIHAKKEIPFEMSMLARLQLDVICFKYNRCKLEEAINESLQKKDKESFRRISEQYKEYIWK
ncbi:IDEAL domain-containing protein [Oceanobacillus luteolus]|uniref:IDEAL domain-containing protein n=1 Tax=Oceanobacillus luteolus TaxID=1274358 RepID=A0ABW4HTH6_9BACI|nr:IDEAL domain-containing protein [Oceanobacillus luteolus]MCM3739591.1 IDEAL domain-containing protein [Oceanobacillus luteolus]